MYSESSFKSGLEGRSGGGTEGRTSRQSDLCGQRLRWFGVPPCPQLFCVPVGGLQAVAELLQVDYEMHKMTRDPLNLALRRYAGMTLTNLTFGDVANKVPGWAGGQASIPQSKLLGIIPTSKQHWEVGPDVLNLQTPSPRPWPLGCSAASHCGGLWQRKPVSVPP